jgi:hypothetical protein
MLNGKSVKALGDPATVRTVPLAEEFKPVWLNVTWYCVFQLPVTVAGEVTVNGEAGPVPPIATNCTPGLLLCTVGV